ncbi:MAG: tyrosine-type recombinase/integrase [Gammaproteobacteria bacterium]|jgi:integrase
MAGVESVITIDQDFFTGRYSSKTKRRATQPNANTQLTSRQIDRVVKAAKENGKHGTRNATLILMAYRHGLRVNELINLKWIHIDLEAGNVLVSRLKNGQKTIQPLTKQEVTYLVELEQRYPDSEYVFLSERKTPLSTAVVHKMVKQAGARAGLPSTVQTYLLQPANSFNFSSTNPH